MYSAWRYGINITVNAGIKKDIQYWIDIARYDLDTASALLKTRRYLYVLFMCQQCLEKMLKAMVILETKKFPPRIHNLVRLAEAAGIDRDKIDFEFLDKLSFYYIESRYPEEHINLHKQVTKKLSESYYETARRIYRWLEKQLI